LGQISPRIRTWELEAKEKKLREEKNGLRLYSSRVFGGGDGKPPSRMAGSGTVINFGAMTLLRREDSNNKRGGGEKKDFYTA